MEEILSISPHLYVIRVHFYHSSIISAIAKGCNLLQKGTCAHFSHQRLYASCTIIISSKPSFRRQQAKHHRLSCITPIWTTRGPRWRRDGSRPVICHVSVAVMDASGPARISILKALIHARGIPLFHDGNCFMSREKLIPLLPNWHVPVLFMRRARTNRFLIIEAATANWVMDSRGDFHHAGDRGAAEWLRRLDYSQRWNPFHHASFSSACLVRLRKHSVVDHLNINVVLYVSFLSHLQKAMVIVSC